MTSQIRLASWLVLCVVLLAACGKGPESSSPSVAPAGQQPQPEQPAPPAPTPTPEPPTPVPPPHPNPHPTPEPTPTPPPVQGDLPYFHRASLWAGPRPNSMSWTRTVISIVQNRIRDFEQARDKETFCPGYASATPAQREVCWLRLVGSVVEFESSFTPDEKPFYEGNGIYSVGLLALSTGECPNAMTTRELMDPVKNLVCGVNKMAMLIARGNAIDSADNGGAAAYWSTLRPPHKAQLPDGRWVTLGKKDKIIARTRVFKQFH